MSREAFDAWSKHKVFPNGGVTVEFMLAIDELRESWSDWQAAIAWAYADAARVCDAAEKSAHPADLADAIRARAKEVCK